MGLKVYFGFFDGILGLEVPWTWVLSLRVRWFEIKGLGVIVSASCDSLPMEELKLVDGRVTEQKTKLHVFQTFSSKEVFQLPQPLKIGINNRPLLLGLRILKRPHHSALIGSGLWGLGAAAQGLQGHIMGSTTPLPSTLKRGYRAPRSGYLGQKRGQLQGLVYLDPPPGFP